MTHKGTVTFETKRLVLRRFTLTDLEQIFVNCWSDPDVWKWTNYKPMSCIEDVIDIAEMFTDKWLGAYDKPNRYSWAIQLKSSGEVIGRLFGMYPDEQLKQIELAYELGRNWWNQGLMTEAVKEVIGFFFNEVGFNRIQSHHAAKNPASGKVMQKCGMVYEGTMRQMCRCNNGLFDKVNYAILVEDYFGIVDNTYYATPKYVRIQTRECAYLTGKPRGIFASVHKLMEAGRLTVDEVKQFDYIDHDWFQRELPNPPFYDDDTPGKPITWFKTATTAHMLNKVQPLMDMLDRNGVPYDVVYTNMPGKIVYEDNWQVAVLD